MTASILPPRCYLDPGIFAAEQRRIFRRLWIFAGVASLLTEPDSFLTRSIGGVPVLVQNCGGELRAFENQCAHRQMPLQFEEYGQRRMACRYHGWVYAHDGSVRSMPDEANLYRYGPDERAGLRLKRFAVETVGNLVFVCLDPSPPPIGEQFGPEVLERMRAMSAQFGAEAVTVRIPARYNWKLNFENVLDANHVPYVHPRSFQPLLKGLPRLPQETTPGWRAAESLADLSFIADSPYTLMPQPWHAQVERFGDADRYYNCYLYPNINFISLAGYVFLIQQFDPVAPDRTDVLFTLAVARERRRLPALPAILWGHLKGEKRVLDEDVAVLERLQAALHEDSPRANHGAYESRLTDVARFYARLMEGAL